jgi:pyridoxine 5-phosphate synthase
MHSAGIEVSFFVEPEQSQIDASKQAGADIVEIHTGKYANLVKEQDILQELEKIKNAAHYAKSIGLRVAAGHGLNYRNVLPICKIDAIDELSIGHSIISRSVFVGIERAVKEMIEIINSASLIR